MFPLLHGSVPKETRTESRAVPLNPLSRYVLSQHLGPFLFGCSLIVFVLVIDVALQMMDRVLSRGLSFIAAGQLFFYNLGWIVALAVPMAVLVAVLMAFGRLSADSEILALKSSGISLVQLMKPVLVAAAALTALMVLFNDRVLPDWNHKARSIQADLKRRKAALVLKQKEGLFIRDLGGYSLLIRRVDEEANRLYGLTLVDGGRSGPPQTLHADSAEVRIFDDGEYMRLTLFDGEFHRIDADDPLQFVEGRFERQVIHITDRDRASRKYPSSSSSYRSDREMDIGAMMTAVADYRVEQDREAAAMDSAVHAFLDTVAASYGTTAGDETGEGLSEPSLPARAEKIAKQLHRQRRLNQNRERRANAYLVEIHKKFSIAAACIVFVLVGAPAGALVRTRGAATAVVLSLVFFFVYWMFLIGGEGLADRGYVPPALAMWAPNLCFGGLGILLLRVVALDQPTGGRFGQRLLTALAYYRPGARVR